MSKPVISSDINGNIFAVLGAASMVLKRNALQDKAKEMSDRVQKSESYDQALAIIMEYVDFE